MEVGSGRVYFRFFSRVFTIFFAENGIFFLFCKYFKSWILPSSKIFPFQRFTGVMLASSVCLEKFKTANEIQGKGGRSFVSNSCTMNPADPYAVDYRP